MKRRWMRGPDAEVARLLLDAGRADEPIAVKRRVLLAATAALTTTSLGTGSAAAGGAAAGGGTAAGKVGVASIVSLKVACRPRCERNPWGDGSYRASWHEWSLEHGGVARQTGACGFCRDGLRLKGVRGASRRSNPLGNHVRRNDASAERSSATVAARCRRRCARAPSPVPFYFLVVRGRSLVTGPSAHSDRFGTACGCPLAARRLRRALPARCHGT